MRVLLSLHETKLDAVRGLSNQEVSPPPSPSDAATSDKDKQICFMLMPRTWFNMEEFR